MGSMPARVARSAGRAIWDMPQLQAREAHYLAALCISLVLPILVFAALIGWYYIDAERSRLEERAREVTQTVRTAIENDLTGLTAIVATLATNRALTEGDYDVFDRRAREIARRIGINIVVRDVDGQQMVNTRVEREADLPRAVVPAFDEEVIRTRRVMVSGVIIGAIAGTPLITIIAPVIRGNEVVALINLSLPSERVLALIQGEKPFSEWNAFVLDGEGRVVAHSHAHSTVAGRPVDAERLALMQAADGMYLDRDSAGKEVLVVYQRSPLSGWLVGLEVPLAVLEAPLRQTLAAFGALGFVLIAVSTAATLLIASILRRATQQVAAAAKDLGRGLVVEPPSTAVVEANFLGNAIADASAELAERTGRLRESEARLRRIIDSLFSFVGVLDLDARLIELNEAPLQAAGLTRDDVIGKPFWDCYWWSYSGEVQQRVKEAVRSAREGRPVRFDIDIRVAGGQMMTIDFQIAPLRDEKGAIIGLVPSAVDITERKRGEEQNARLAAIVSSTTDAVISFAADSRSIRTWNKAAEMLFGYTEEEVIGMPVSLLHIPSSNAVKRTEAGIFDLVMERGQVEIEGRRRRKDGSIVDVWIAGSQIIDAEGRLIGVSAIYRDIGPRKKAEEQQKLLIRELHHRIKNTLATVQAIAGATMRSAETMEAFRDSFAARLDALARSHSLLTENAWRGVMLRDLLHDSLASFCGDDQKRITLHGPDIHLRPNDALALGLVAHELATNAIKYGALSVPEGRVALTWEAAACGEEEGSSSVRLSWVETGGPAVGQPTRYGFGSRLLERVVVSQMKGGLSVDYAPSGVRAEINVNLTRDGEDEADRLRLGDPDSVNRD